MTAVIQNNTALRNRIVGVLFDGGYPDYAVSLAAFRNVSTITGKYGATDYQNLFVDETLNDDELSLVVRHEILHVILNHRKRFKSYHKPNLWNMACDFELSNYYSYHDDQVMLGSERLCTGCSVAINSEYQGLVAEEIYDKLLFNHYGNSGGSDDDDDPPPKQEGQGGQDCRDDDSPHLDLSPDEQEQLRKDMQQELSDAYDSLSAEDQAIVDSSILRVGSPGLGGKQDICIASEPPEPEDVRLYFDLRRFFLRQQEVCKGRSYKRPNKKYQGSGIVVKSRTNVYQEQRTLAVYVDVSGSMSRQMVARALGVVEKMQGMKRTKFIVKYFSTHIRDNFYTGGGTDYEIIFKDAKENNYTCLAIITDDSYSGFRNNYRVEALWLIGIDAHAYDSSGRTYSIEYLVNKPDGTITADHFKVSIVGHD